MTEYKSRLPHDKDVRVAIDEIACAHTINRNIQYLIENDIECKNISKDIFGGLKISSYVKSDNNSYNYGSIVWYTLEDEKLIKKGFSRLWLLQCISNGNDGRGNNQDPINAFNNLNEYGQPDFQKFGWMDLNEHIDIFSKEIGLSSLIQQRITQEINQHSHDDQYHPYGKLINDKYSSDSIDKKIMVKNLANISSNRSNGFFPYQSGHFKDDTILNGTYRIWDCGLLEFDIVFRLGYIGVDQDGYNIISCNNVRFQQSPTRLVAADGFQENINYFYSIDDMKMFQNSDGDHIYETTIGNMRQGNRNNHVNTYFAQINFPKLTFKNNTVRFNDLNYMVFSSNILSQDKNLINKTMSLNSNNMTWCNKTRDGITAMLITYPENNQQGFGEKGGLAANSFSCSVIGRWK